MIIFAIQRESSMQSLGDFHEYCKIFKNRVFIEKNCFFQFDKVTVQYLASADLLFLIRNTMLNGLY